MTIFFAAVSILALRFFWRRFCNIAMIKIRWPHPNHTEPRAWDALKGILPGAAVGALIYPMLPLIVVNTYTIYFQDQKILVFTSIAKGLGETILALLALFVIMFGIWCIAIALSVQIWSLICWNAVRGIWAAAILGVVLAVLVELASSGFSFESYYQIIVDLLMGCAGGASGATVWWAAYRKSS